MKVRDFRGNVPQARTRSLSERYQALDDEKKNERRESKDSNRVTKKMRRVVCFNASTVRRHGAQRSESALTLCQSQSGNDTLEIVVAVVFDLDPAPFLSVMNGHVRRELFLQSIL